MEPMYWTRKAPQVPGWYWWRRLPKIKPCICEVYEFDGVLMNSGKGGEWSSKPIAMPTGGNDAVDRYRD